MWKGRITLALAPYITLKSVQGKFSGRRRDHWGWSLYTKRGHHHPAHENWLLQPRHQEEAGAQKGLPVAPTPRSRVCPQAPSGGSLCGSLDGSSGRVKVGRGGGTRPRRRTTCPSEPLMSKVGQRHEGRLPVISVSQNLRLISETNALRVSWGARVWEVSPLRSIPGPCASLRL